LAAGPFDPKLSPDGHKLVCWIGTWSTWFSAAEQLSLRHLLDAVPALSITSTLHWSEIRAYDNWTSGVVVLAFKLIAFSPILGGIVLLVRFVWVATAGRKAQADR
jgi:hypothetical protein